MTVADRFTGWIEELASAWKDRLQGWMAGWAMKGVQDFLESIEPDSIEQTRAAIDKIRANPKTPPEVKAYLDKFQAGGFNPLIIIGIVMVVAQLIQVIQTLWAPTQKQMSYIEEQAALTFRLDPYSVITAWRRDPAKYAAMFADLKDQGVSDDRIEALKFITQIIPNAADIVRFALREVYTPEIAEKYGQYQDIPTGAYEDAARAGLSTDMFDKYWAAHWMLPGSQDGFDMLHRGILTEDELKGLLKANDVMPYWRDQLIKLAWNIPTRVDVRRFWDMRTIDEARLRQIYTGLGYHAQDLEDYVLWTKIYVDFPNLLARYKNGWIDLEQVKRELIAMGMQPDRADTMIEEKIKKEAPERVAGERTLTKADIIGGVKKDVITRDEAAGLLTDLGYSNDDAVYILDVSIPTDEVTSVKTARELTKSDILAGLKTGLITEQDARNKLLELRYTATDADFMLKVYKSAAKPPAEPNQKEASKADIVSAVKKGLITQEAGYMMLLDIGFAADAAIFILSVATEQSPFSPMNFDEFKDRTQKYRLAAGLEGKPTTDELKKLGALVVKLTGEVDVLQRSIKAEQDKFAVPEGAPAAVTVRLKELEGTLHKAQSELIRVRTDYNAKVAEWRHAGK